jgi:hypothetical protein
VVAQVIEYTTEEHRLLAEVQRKAKSIPPGVRLIIERRRSGGSYQDLQKLTDDLLKGNILARSAVLDWLDAEFAPKAPDDPPAQRPVVKPLQR